MLKEASRIKEPEREFSFHRIIWRPSHWIVEKIENGREKEQVKPVITEKNFLSRDALLQSEDSNVSKPFLIHD